jgi:hypothetical protein
MTMNESKPSQIALGHSRSKGKYLLTLLPFLAALGCTQQLSVDSNENPELSEQQLCSVSVTPLRSIEIVHPAVIATARASNLTDGPWSFRGLMERMAPTAAQADVDRMLRGMFESWLTDQVVNGQTIGGRSSADSVILQQFVVSGSNPRSFDLSRAPFQLIAIATRVDLRSANDAGELRFVFGFTQQGTLAPMTVNVEYKLPFTAQFDTATKWAAKIHELDGLDPATSSEAFAARLQEITDIVTARGAAPSKPNGSSISQIRTNEIVLAIPWEMREFNLNSSGVLAEATTKNSPNHETINNSTKLSDFLAQTPALNTTTDTSFMSVTMPLSFEGQAFLGGQAHESTTSVVVGTHAVSSDAWWLGNQTGDDSVPLDNFGLLTCNGCHQANKPPGDIPFYQVSPTANPQNPTTGVNDGTGRLSLFMTAGDPAKGGRRPAEFTRRATDMTNLLCAAPTGPDLVVTGVSFSPGNAAAGQPVTFSATVQNQGTSATPAGTIVGVRFDVDGAIATWSDTDTQSLAPGASVTLTANNGPSGHSTWSATSGGHTLQAWADDVNRIAESDENNNKLTVPLSIGIDLLVTSVSLSPAHPTAGVPVTFSATVKNQGTLATPAGTIVGVRFDVDGAVANWSDTNRNSLAPGASVTLTANSGPTGSATWTAANGSHSLQAWVDDVNRLNDVNRNNQKFITGFSLP